MGLLKHFVVVHLITFVKVVASGPTLDDIMYVPGWTSPILNTWLHLYVYETTIALWRLGLVVARWSRSTKLLYRLHRARLVRDG